MECVCCKYNLGKNFENCGGSAHGICPECGTEQPDGPAVLYFDEHNKHLHTWVATTPVCMSTLKNIALELDSVKMRDIVRYVIFDGKTVKSDRRIII